ncbi:uncharacterized protein CG31750 isoform X2 [Drosophila biarmipes]|uniref:uncharacterized protein CG31750 isoform X2 n=1 Tax=Drosophila biarmipes TaxID=125945 RepID=UPI0007E785A9|nr:uncharacterized protein CG31750 isoform X2 [Drosophila biarmipes]
MKTVRNSHKIWQTRVLRWSVLGICWTSYIIYRSCVIGQIKYDKEKGKLVIQPRNIWTKRIVLCLKIIVLYLNYCGIPYIMIAIIPLLPREIFKAAFSSPNLSWNRSFVGLANDVIHLITLMEVNVGPLYLERISLLILHFLQLGLTLVQVVGYSQMQLHLCSLYNLLLELFFNMFVVYQLLILSWMAAFCRFLKIYLQEPTIGQRLKVLRLFRLYARISNVHQNIQLMWLPVINMLFSDILMLVSHWSFIIKSIILNRLEDDLNSKYWKAAFGAQASLLRILFIGLCNDQLALLQSFIRLQLLAIDLCFSKLDQLDLNFVWEAKILQTCFDLQSRAQPIKNRIMSIYQECGCPFVLNFFFCAMINAFCCAQYDIFFSVDSVISPML